jgi:hypothetical protein
MLQRYAARRGAARARGRLSVRSAMRIRLNVTRHLHISPLPPLQRLCQQRALDAFKLDPAQCV